MLRLSLSLTVLLMSGCITTGAGSETIAPTVTCLFTIGDCYDDENESAPTVTTESGDIVKGELDSFNACIGGMCDHLTE